MGGQFAATAVSLIATCASRGSRATSTAARAGGEATGPVGPSVPDPAKIRAVTLDARHPPADGVPERLRDLGATHITLVSFGFQRRADVPRIRMHTDAGQYSESDAGIRALARRTDTLGLGLILKPHIWVGDYSADGQRRHHIGFDTEAAWGPDGKQRTAAS